MQYLETRDDKYFLNLKFIVYQELINNGILEHHIENINFCTSCSKDIFFSARRRTSDEERGSAFGSFISLSS
ncbi:MAG: laccase domain-containing protein [Tolypothrix carrinoi HA7290-LM1]|jgi:hypothetical protein|nr:laccase domain-containing protein [Tolypothrix carrinoi HA7290-LM1]